MTRPRTRLKMSESHWRDRDWKIWVSMARPRPRLEKSESQWRDWAKVVDTETPSRLSHCLAAFLGLMTQEYFDNLWMSRPRLIETWIYVGCRDRDSSRLRNFLDVETETHRDWEISWMSRPRLIETEKFLGCRDRDSSRLRNFRDVETETHWDREIWWMSRPRPVVTGQKMSIPRLHRDSRWSLTSLELATQLGMPNHSAVVGAGSFAVVVGWMGGMGRILHWEFTIRRKKKDRR